MIDGLKPYPAYKDSGVPWLGKVPEHWEVCTVRHITRPVKGRQPKALHSEEEAPVGAQPYLTMEYLRGNIGTVKVYYARSDGLVTAEAGDVLLLWDGANAGEFFTAKAGIVSSTAALLPITERSKRYLYFMLKQCEPCLRALSTGMGIPHVDGRLLKEMQICLPPLSEQTAIVRFLDYMDRRIRRVIHARQRQIKLLEEYRQALIHQAVTGQIDVRTGKPYPAYKDSGVPWLGQVPEHWEVAQVKDVFDCLNHRRVPLSSTERGAMKNRRYDYYGASGVIDKVDDYLFDDELLLIAEDGANLVLRNLPLAIVARGRFWVNNHAHVLKPRNGNIEFLASLMETIDYKPWISGATQPKLTKDRLLSIAIATPPRQEQTEIIKAIHASKVASSNLIQHARREIELLREYRERMIADVVTGKVDVRELAARLPEEPPEEDSEWMGTEEMADEDTADEESGAEVLSEEGDP
jgi:type I restriction enzyme S subunit